MAPLVTHIFWGGADGCWSENVFTSSFNHVSILKLHHNYYTCMFMLSVQYSQRLETLYTCTSTHTQQSTHTHTTLCTHTLYTHTTANSLWNTAVTSYDMTWHVCRIATLLTIKPHHDLCSVRMWSCSNLTPILPHHHLWTTVMGALRKFSNRGGGGGGMP